MSPSIQITQKQLSDNSEEEQDFRPS